jgi:hypothetical protein
MAWTSSNAERRWVKMIYQQINNVTMAKHGRNITPANALHKPGWDRNPLNDTNELGLSKLNR